jgi:DNA-binding NarL/FixJ family response regulator
MRILIADDHPLILAGVRRSLERDTDFDVVGATCSGTEVLPLVGQLSPDVVLLDMRMPGLDGLGCLGRIRDRYPAVKVVMLSVQADQEHVQAAFKLGASGYVVKTIASVDLPSAVRQAVEGTAFHALGVPEPKKPGTMTSGGLTERELTIMKTVARGLSNQAIARELWVTEQTVKFHLTNVYKKLGVANRTEAARWAFDNGLVDGTAADAAEVVGAHA